MIDLSSPVAVGTMKPTAIPLFLNDCSVSATGVFDIESIAIPCVEALPRGQTLAISSFLPLKDNDTSLIQAHTISFSAKTPGHICMTQLHCLTYPITCEPSH